MDWRNKMSKLSDVFKELLSLHGKNKKSLIQETHEKTEVEIKIIEERLNKLLAQSSDFIEYEGIIFSGETAQDLKLELKTYQELMELIHRDKFKLIGTTNKFVSIDKPGIAMSYSVFTLQKDEDEIKIRVEDDKSSIDFAWNHQYMGDDLDGKTFHKIANKGKYYEDIDLIAKDFDNKINDAITKIKKGESEIAKSSEYDLLLEEFLLSPNALYDKKYLPLKENYHEIYAKILFESQHYLSIYTNAKKKNKNVEKYGKLLDTLGSTFINKDGPIKNYREFKKYVETNPSLFASKAQQQKEYLDYLYKGAAAISPLPIRIGFLQILDGYRRFAELVRNPIRDIRKIIQFRNRVNIDSNQNNYDEDVDIISKDSTFKEIVEGIHPIVRHSESHLFTRIDEDKQIVYVQDDESGKKFEFDTRKDIYEKQIIIQSGLVPALLAFYSGTDLVLKLLSMRSKEFLHRVILIGNTKK